MTRGRGRCLAVLALVLVLASGASLMAVAGNAAAYSPVEISMEVPSFAATGQKIPATLRVTGGPAEETGQNYTFKAEIVAKNTTGSSVSPATGSSASGVWRLNITMPGEAQTIKVRINATSKGVLTADSVSRVKEFEIKVVQPILIKVTVYNTGAVDAEDVSAKFYADGILLGTERFDVAAGSSTEVMHNWTWSNLADGKHTVTVVLDEGNHLVEFSDGNNVLTQTVYVGEQGNPIGGALTVGVIIMSVLVALTMMAKPAKRRK